MSAQVKNGKRPLATKPRQSALRHDDIFFSQLHVDEELRNEIEKSGKEMRWIDAKQAIENGGFHKAGWTVYRRDMKAASDTMGFKLGNDPEGIVRRGSCVLAVRPKAQGDRHRAYLAQAVARQGGSAKEAGEQLRDMARAQNVDAAVDDSFDE